MSQVIAGANRDETYAGYADLIVMACPCCGITYAMPHRLQEAAHSKGNRAIVWYCPNGHELGYNGDSEEEKERKRAERRAELAEDRAARAVAQRDQAEQDARIHKGRATRFRNERDRMKTRIANGVCPCCNRSFKNVRLHMRSKHPEALEKLAP